MSELVLTTLKFLFLALLYLFIARAMRIIWLDIAGTRTGRATAPGPVRPTQRPAARPTGKAAREAPRSLQVTEDGQAPRIYPLRDQAVTIGRADECTVPLHDTYVSQMHTKIFPKDGVWQVMDLGSTNGTYLNRVKISDPMPLAPGDEVRLGKTIVEVRAK